MNEVMSMDESHAEENPVYNRSMPRIPQFHMKSISHLPFHT